MAEAAGDGGNSATVPAHELMGLAERGGDLVDRFAGDERADNFAIQGLKLGAQFYQEVVSDDRVNERIGGLQGRVVVNLTREVQSLVGVKTAARIEVITEIEIAPLEVPALGGVRILLCALPQKDETDLK